MELNSTINVWKLCTFCSLLGCLILILFLNQTQSNVSTLASRNMAMFELAPLAELEPPSSTNSRPPRPSNVTFGAIDAKLEPPNSAISKPMMPFNVSFDAGSAISESPRYSNVTLDHIAKPTRSMKRNITLTHIQKPVNKTYRECNIFEGRWVYKPEEVPSYDTNTCPFLEEKMSCRKNGRPDFEYEKWRWEATDCNIPLFNGTYMLERLRNKRVIIVGDSLNRNMWESLACLLYSSIPSSRAEVQARHPTYKLFKAKDYNCVIEFYWSPFLVELNKQHGSGSKVLMLDKLSPSSSQWRGADVMVFNSGHWWTHLGKLKSWDLFEYEGKLAKEMPIELAYRRGMTTWSKWIKQNIDPKKTTVIFRSISPEHTTSKQWCYNVTQPIKDESYESTFPKSLIEIIEGIIKDMGSLHVKYLNITKLSSYRRDAHPSAYRSWKWKIYTTKYKRFLPSFADCSHWCLPGLPDTWNRLLYASLFFNTPSVSER